MIRAILSLVAFGITFLGFWLIAASFTDSTPAKAPASQVIAGPSQTASPIIIGTALLAGGVIFLVLIFRRR